MRTEQDLLDQLERTQASEARLYDALRNVVALHETPADSPLQALAEETWAEARAAVNGTIFELAV